MQGLNFGKGIGADVEKTTQRNVKYKKGRDHFSRQKNPRPFPKKKVLTLS